MRYFIVIDYPASAFFDQFRGIDFKDALMNSLKDDPEMLGWNPEGLEEYGISAKFINKKWKFEEGHFEKYVDMIQKSYNSRRDEIQILDITDPLDVQQVIN